MLPPFHIDDITKKILEVLPFSQGLEEDIKNQIKMVLQGTFAKLDLVSREEFDVQTQVLAKTREKIETLEKQVQMLLTKPQ
ncbi:MAG: accessory factor UbiK family protein [Gammaproteobacteria bacterium]|nr:accessory factor UbiK family protein [Gammaproteobacteria bacterium]